MCKPCTVLNKKTHSLNGRSLMNELDAQILEAIKSKPGQKADVGAVEELGFAGLHPVVNHLRKLFSRMEGWSLTAPQAVVTFVLIVWLRQVLELMLEGRQVLTLHLSLRNGLADLLHVTVSWAVVFVLIAFEKLWDVVD